MTKLSQLRVLLTTDAVGGVWTFAAALASALAARGADVHLVVQGPAPDDHRRSMMPQGAVRLVQSALALEWQDPGAADLEAARRYYLDLAREIRPDIVHLNSFREATFDWSCPVLVTAHSCVNSWALACADHSWLSDEKWQRYTRCVAAGLNRATAWAAPTGAFGDIVQRIHRPRSAGLAIWNGVAPTDAVEPKQPFTLAAGRMDDAAKNLPALAQAAAGLEWPVVVAGSTSKAVPVTPELRLVGELSHADLSVLMRRAAIFASPARYEPFGLAVLEAARAGCALVLSDIPTFRELWNDAALFVDPNHPGQLHRALRDLCADARRRTQLQCAARARSLRYRLDRMVESYAALYQNLLAPTVSKSAAAGGVYA